MRIIIQRVTCQVCVNNEIVGKTEWMVRKCLELRLFGSEEEANRWQKSIQEVGGEILVISQFTLYG